MKRSIKKAIAFVLFLAMTLQLVSFGTPKLARAAEATETSDFDIWDTNLYGYYGTDSEVTIPDGITYVSIWSGDTIEKLNVPEGVTSLSLGYLPNLTELVIPSTVTYLYLTGCSGLKSVDLTGLKLENDYAYISLSALDIESIEATGFKGEIYIYACNSLKSLDLSDAELETFSINKCKALQTLKLKNVKYSIDISDLPALKSADIPGYVDYLSIEGTDFDKIELLADEDYSNYFIENGGLYRYEKVYGQADPVLYLKAIDGTKKTVDVIDGTTVIGYLGISGATYKTTTINLPDSVEELDDYAFANGSNLKNITLPKNLVSIGYYAFAEVEINKIVIPSSVTYIATDAFGGYEGKVELEENTKYVTEYEGGIYRTAYFEDGSANFTSLVYYPANKTSIKFMDGTTYIGSYVFLNSNVKSLDIPEGVDWVDLYLYNAKNLKSLSIPASAYGVSLETIESAPGLKTFKVSEDNPFYTSYDNCLYDKNMITYLAAPQTKINVTIPEGVISLSYYALSSFYVEDPNEEFGYKYVKRTFTLPSTLENYNSYDFGFEKVYVYAGTDFAAYLQAYNKEEREWAEEYGWEPYTYDYELRDSNKDLLNSIYVVDSVSVKKGKKTTATIELPYGLDQVAKLTRGNNTECQVKFSSSDKKIAKVNSKTGVITGVKKGTCTINVKCTINNGKKKTTKTFKIKVKVK